MEDTNCLNNSVNPVIEIISYFKDENQKEKQKQQNLIYRFENT